MKTQSRLTHLLFAMAFLFSFNGIISAQGVLFKYTDEPHQLTEAEQAKVDQLYQNERYEKIYPVTISPLSKAIKNGQLNINLPGANEPFVLNTVRAEGSSDEDFYWYGEGEEGSCSFGGSTEGMNGSIQNGLDRFIFFSLDSKRTYLLMLRQGEKNVCVSNSSKVNTVQEKMNEQNVNHRTSCISTNISVLFLYTDEAESESIWSIAFTASQIIDQLNSAVQNSGLSANDIEYYLAGVKNMDNVQISGNIFSDMNALKNNNSVKQQRNSNKADIVVLLTEDAYGPNGVAGGNGASKANAYVIVEIGPAFNSLSAAHEIGHIMGCTHQLCTVTPIDGCTYPWPGISWNANGWAIDNSHITIMHQEDGSNRVLHFSNPGETYAGSPTGNASANCANTILNRANEVACFYPNSIFDQQFSVHIDGPYTLQPWQYGYWSADVNYAHVSPPSTYAWEISPNGFSNWTYVSNSTSYSASATNLPSWFALRLTVTSSDGYSDSDYHYVTNNGGIQQYAIHDAMHFSFDEHDINVFPNPANESITINVPDDQLNYNIYHISGKLVYSLERETLEGRKNILVDISKYPSGMYYIASENYRYGSKFIKEE